MDYPAATFHRQDGPRSQLAGASRAVLERLGADRPSPEQTPWPSTTRHGMAASCRF